MPDYGDINGGLPLDWQPDPNWVPPPHWGYGPPDAPPPDPFAAPALGPELAAAPAIPMPPPPVDAALEGVPAPADVGPEPPPIATPPGFAPTAIPAPAPDALTGAGGMPAAGELGGVPYAPSLTPTQTREQLVAQYGDNPLAIPDPALREQYLNALAQRDPQKFAEVMLRHEEEKRKTLEARRIEMINRDYDQQVANLKARQDADRATQEKMSAALADAERIASTKIDPTGGVNGSRAIASVLGAVIGGLVQGRTGSARNAGMDALNDTINRGIDAQKANLENQRAGLAFRRSVLTDEFARHGNEFQATETIRLAALKHADDLLASAQQDYDPQGTMALKIAATRAGIAAQQQQGLQAFQQKTFENELKVQDARRQQQLADEAQRHNKATEGIESAKLDKTNKQVWSPEQLGILNPGLPKPPIPMSQADYTKWLGTQKQGEEYKTAARGNDPTELTRLRSVPGITDDKGQLVQFADKDIASKVADAKESVSETIRLTDELIKMVQEHGYENGFVKSKQWRQALQNYNEILIRKKETDKLGVLTGPDVGIVTKEIGTDDPTEFRSGQAIDALKHFRTNQVEGFNSKIFNKAIVGDGRALKRWEPPPLDTAPAQTTPEQVRIERLHSPPHASLEEEVNREIQRRREGLSPDEVRALGGPVSLQPSRKDPALSETLALQAMTPGQRDAYDYVKSHYDPGASIDQQHEIATLGVTARGDDAEAAAARQTLGDIAAAAKTGSLRRLAKAALDRAVMPIGSSVPTSMSAPDAAVGYETAPPPERGKR